MKVPKRRDVERVLEGLIDGSLSRETASDWAVEAIESGDQQEGWTTAIDDAVSAVVGADTVRWGRDGYLYGPEDFADWLGEFREAWPEQG